MVITEYVSDPKSVAEKAYEKHGGSTNYSEMVRNVISLVPGLTVKYHETFGTWRVTHKFEIEDVESGDVYEFSLAYGSCAVWDTLLAARGNKGDIIRFYLHILQNIG